VGSEFVVKRRWVAGTGHDSRISIGHCPKACNDSIHWAEIRRSLSRAIEDQKLMLDEQRFGDAGTSTARSEQAGNRYDKVYEKYGEITHH